LAPLDLGNLITKVFEQRFGAVNKSRKVFRAINKLKIASLVLALVNEWNYQILSANNHFNTVLIIWSLKMVSQTKEKYYICKTY
jgi:hypothetical protein